MSFAPTLQIHAPMIQSYGPAGFRISGKDYASSVLVTAEAVTPLSITSLEEISQEILAPVIANAPPLEVLLIGTGTTHALLSPEFRSELKTYGLNPDAMATGAAARTFNILLSEERRVAALLLLPQ